MAGPVAWLPNRDLILKTLNQARTSVRHEFIGQLITSGSDRSISVWVPHPCQAWCWAVGILIELKIKWFLPLGSYQSIGETDKLGHNK